MAKSNRRAMIILIATAALVIGVMQGYRLMRDRSIAREVEQARAAALASASSATRPGAARRWLEQNGFQVVFWNPQDPRRGFIATQFGGGTGGQHLIVKGQRPIRRSLGEMQPKWLDVTFRFT